MKLLIALSLFVLINAQTPILPGAKFDVDPKSPNVVEAANFAYNLIVNSINSIYTHKMGNVIKAQFEVVAGVKYYLTIEVSETSCKKADKDPVNCDVTKTEICEVVILSQPWDEIKKKELLSYQCNSSNY